MVMDCGMSQLGKVNFRESRRSAFLAGAEEFPRERSHSEQTSREIDEEIARIVDQSLGRVRSILQTRRKALVALAERLIEKEVIDNEELRQIVEANAPSAAIVPGTTGAAVRRAVEEPIAAGETKKVEGG
jgi:cell division protease FtsH